MNQTDFQNTFKTKIYLHFKDGTKFSGLSNFPADKLQQGIWGESAFTTGMSGYEETATDPSFLGQHIIFSTAHVGNYESNDIVKQSNSIHCTSIIAKSLSYNEFFENADVPLIQNLDTRGLIKYLTSHPNSHLSVITTSENTPTESEFSQGKLFCSDLSKVSIQDKIIHKEGDKPIVLIDYGVKTAIVNNLKDMDLPFVQVPYTIKSEEVLSLGPSLVFLSNGPGDPRNYTSEVEEVKKILASNVPVRGICLGHQLISLALGAKIEKLPFGQRGINHPVIDHVSGNILITSQNHGYATETESFNLVKENNELDLQFFTQYTSLFDYSIEGISTSNHQVKSVQFHPEANPGPMDGQVFFKEIENYLKNERAKNIDTSKLNKYEKLTETKKKDIPYKKILLIGSGPIKIGQASEFDYSGTQACKSLKEIGIDVVLLNSNPATIMTDADMAYRTYIEPITKETIKKIIKKEKVDAVLSTMGGQTALNICIELESESFLKNNNVALLGAKVDTIEKTEDRHLFAEELKTLSIQTGTRFTANNESECLLLASSKVGYPLIIRRDFALGGKGAALIHSDDELKEIFKTDITFPLTMEKSLLGFKEVELEVMVDKDKNGVVICSIENVDPCGIHTGDSITVAPAQTISDRCYQQLRTMSLKIAKHMGVVAGGANVQFAINPNDEDDIVVIEMNPRVSRSSALASKATGYPIAKISALLAVGYTLPEILNDITKVSPVSFEPTLDYVALKIPIFPFHKFPSSSRELGPQMRSVGEVLALGPSFTEAFLKALRSLERGLEVPSLSVLKTTPLNLDEEYLENRLSSARELSLLTVLEAIRVGISKDKINKLSNITPWFIDQAEKIFELESKAKEEDIFNNKELFLELKRQGFSDKYISYLKNIPQKEVLQYRYDNKLFPSYLAVDTCSGEFNAYTPYFYSSYIGKNEAESFGKTGNESIAILGSGPNRIGQGIEFDYSCVKSCQEIQKESKKAIMINSNPETVSTDYDSSDRLYLSPLYSEDLFDIFKNESPNGVITSFSGQTGIKIREHIEETFRNEFDRYTFLGASLKSLHLSEDREKFAKLTDEVPLSKTQSKEVNSYKKMMTAITEIGTPVIIRPSYVIGGESMYILHSIDDLKELPNDLTSGLKKSMMTFQVENYLENAIEYDVDLIRDQFGNSIYTVCEHIEYAGVHSGDSGMISPPVKIKKDVHQLMKDISKKLADLLEIVGPINFQFAVKDNQIYCIEANPRGSRTLPFLSKTYNLSLPQIATRAMLGKKIENTDEPPKGHYVVKQSTFPFDRFIKDDIILGPKMRSTGETLGVDHNLNNATLKSYLANYPLLEKKGKVLVSIAHKNKHIIGENFVKLAKLGYEFIATAGTRKHLKALDIDSGLVRRIGDEKGDNDQTITEALSDENVVMVFNTPMNIQQSKTDGEVIRNTAIQYGIPCFTRPENISSVISSLTESAGGKMEPVSIQELF